MAEIRVERKRKSSVWPWVAALVALALLIWLVAAMRNDRDDRDSVVVPPAAARIEAAPAVEPAPRRVAGTMPAVLHVPPSLDLLLAFPSA